MTLSRKLLTPFLVVAAGLAVSACDEEAVRPAVSSELEEMQADVVFFEFEYLLTNEGIREAVAYSNEAYTYADSTVTHLRGNVRLVMYDSESGLEVAEVTADWGRLNTSNNALLARGNAVLILREDGRRIDSPELHYAPEQNKIWSDSASTMYSDNRIIEGSGFDSDLEFQKPTIRNARTRSR